MRALLPVPDADVDVHAFYAADWLGTGGLRVNFVSSVDGAVSAAGQSRGLQTPGDNRVFAALRDLADVVLVGAGTARAEDYGPARFNDRRRAVRRTHKLAEDLPVAVVTRSLNLNPAARLFGDPERRPIVITCAAAPAAQRAALAGVADIVDAGVAAVDLAAARAALAQRGMRRILCEGGPALFADLLRAGQVDELCLSVTPLLAGPGAPRISGGEPLPDTADLDLVGLLEEDGALFARYRVSPTPL